MIRIFVDSSVLFSAVYSSRGHSRDILLMAAREEVVLVISSLIVEETLRNLHQAAPQALPALERLIESIPFEYVRPSKREVQAAARHVDLKDAAIVAAAKKARVQLLVTLDKKHLLDRPEVAGFSGMPVATPQAAVKFISENI